MIIIKVGKNEHIERALKRFKRKFRNVQTIKKLRENQYFEKKVRLMKIIKSVEKEINIY
jgi:ribosomal protein S21